MGPQRLSEHPLADGRTLQIAHASIGDAASLVAYVERVSEESDFLTFGPGQFGMSVEDETKFIAELDGGRFNFMLLGRIDGPIVSTCGVVRPRRVRTQHVGVFGLSVAKAFWGLGVGKHMCRAMLGVARQVGITKVNLEVREDNARAIRLYESVGFEREGRTERGLRVGERYYADLRMGICL